jgi:hypothetical protein
MLVMMVKVKDLLSSCQAEQCGGFMLIRNCGELQANCIVQRDDVYLGSPIGENFNDVTVSFVSNFCTVCICVFVVGILR